MAAKLTSATKEGKFDLVKALVRSGHPVNGCDPLDGSTALYWAACMGDLRICDWLIQNGAQVNLAHRKKGSLPLHAASDRGHIDCVYRLIRAGAHINHQTPVNQDTPLHLACYRGYLNLCRLLIAEGANLTLKNRQGNTPHEEALCRRHTKVFEFVRRCAKNQKSRDRVMSGSGGLVKDAEDLLAFQNSVRHRESSPEHAHSAPLAVNMGQHQTPHYIDADSSLSTKQQTSKPHDENEFFDNGGCRCCAMHGNPYFGHLVSSRSNIEKLTQELNKKDERIRHLEAVNEQLKIYTTLFDQKHREVQRLTTENENLRKQSSGKLAWKYSTLPTFDTSTNSLTSFESDQLRMNDYSLDMDGIGRELDEMSSSDDNCSLVSRTATQDQPMGDVSGL